jgi:hypothetical protein
LLFRNCVQIVQRHREAAQPWALHVNGALPSAQNHFEEHLQRNRWIVGLRKSIRHNPASLVTTWHRSGLGASFRIHLIQQTPQSSIYKPCRVRYSNPRPRPGYLGGGGSTRTKACPMPKYAKSIVHLWSAKYRRAGLMEGVSFVLQRHIRGDRIDTSPASASSEQWHTLAASNITSDILLRAAILKLRVTFCTPPPRYLKLRESLS